MEYQANQSHLLLVDESNYNKVNNNLFNQRLVAPLSSTSAAKKKVQKQKKEGVKPSRL